MLTISKLARKFGISRTSILYYERQGLLSPTCRSENGYRWYAAKEVARLENILAYRSFGIPVAKLPDLLDIAKNAKQKQILLEQFNTLEQEIQQLRLQQKAIMQFTEHTEMPASDKMDKNMWVKIMQEAGLSEQDMRNWHIQFEKNGPREHARFLQSLGVSAVEAEVIRAWR